MKAVGYTATGTGLGADVVQDLDLPEPTPRAHDLLVRVKAASVNPRDIKVRKSQAASKDHPQILGWDAAGVVEAVGDAVSRWKVGDEVFYAGSALRPGCLSELHVVDERIVGPKPRNLSFESAAALPLTSLTAYEMLFDRLCVPASDPGKLLLIIGGAGGVASMAIQFAKVLTSLTVIATASRAESERWVRKLGADYVVDHSKSLGPQLKNLGLSPIDFTFTTHTSESTWADIAAAMAAQGRLGLIDDPPPLDLRLMKMKSISIHWESMFTRSAFETPDMSRQHEILCEVARLVESGRIQTTASQAFGTICAENVRMAHLAIEEGHSVGKITLAGFDV